ncbi:MAG: DUF1573 domain-containing protein [Alistipes sp.]
MRKFILLWVACLSFGLAVAQTEGAHLTLTHNSHDFGDIARRGGNARVAFVVINDGTTPLVITQIITSCSCLKASYERRPLAPGGKSLIHITYEPHKAEAGAFYKVIQVYSNSTGGRELITLRGNSIDKQR